MVTTNILELRAFGIRFVFATQSDRNIFPAARDQMPATILCHGAQVKSDVSKLLHDLCMFAERYSVAEGLFVFADGDYYPRHCPWPFPDFPKPAGSRIRYHGKFDSGNEEEEEVDLSVDTGQYASMMIPPDDEGETISRYDLPMEEP
jgi:hypothetical protein